MYEKNRTKTSHFVQNKNNKLINQKYFIPKQSDFSRVNSTMVGKIARNKQFRSQQINLSKNTMYREQHKSLRSIRATETQKQKKKFANQYALITSNFKDLLLRNNKSKSQFSQRVQNGRDEQANQFEAKNLNKKIDEKKLYFFKQRNKKLQKIFSNRYHHEVLAASNSIYKIQLPIKDRAFEAQKQRKINKKFGFIHEVLANFDNLMAIRQYLEDYKNNYELLIKKIKMYVLNNGGADVSKLQTFLKIQQQQNNLRFLLCLEKIVIIGTLDSLVKEKFIEYETKIIFQSILGVYYSIFSYMIKQNMTQSYNQQLKDAICVLDSLQTHKRKDLISTKQFILKKMPLLFRYNQKFFFKIKNLIDDAQDNKYKLNKFFYCTLVEYSINLNQSFQTLNIHKNLLDTFATCPSPHLPFSRRQVKYTILIQLQNCLCWIKGNTNFIMQLRPHTVQVLSKLKKHCEIVLITTLMPQCFTQTPEIFEIVDSVLFKYHCIRYRNHLLKDVSRLGRSLNTIIQIDSKAQNCIHKQNLIKMSSWRGNRLDEQMLSLQRVIETILKENPTDIRETIKNPKQRLMKQQKIQVDSQVVEEVEQNLQKSQKFADNSTVKIQEQNLKSQSGKILQNDRQAFSKQQ